MFQSTANVVRDQSGGRVATNPSQGNADRYRQGYVDRWDPKQDYANWNDYSRTRDGAMGQNRNYSLEQDYDKWQGSQQGRAMQGATHDAMYGSLRGGNTTGGLWGTAMQGGNISTRDGSASGPPVFQNVNTAYNSETKRMALQGLFGSAGGGYGGGGYGGGFSAQGPGGMIAQGSMGPNVNVGGPASYQQFSQPQGPTATPQMQSRYGGQGTFNDALMGMNQQTGVDAARANRQMQNQYYGNAANVQNQGVLGGLGLMNQQMQNAGARTQGAFNAANQWNLW